MLQHVPVFPLSVMPFPGCRMPLRIFEPRYTEMVSQVMRDGTGFVMALSAGESSVQSPYLDPQTGILQKAVWVEIQDFDQGDDGLLHIEVVSRRWVQLDNLYQDGQQLWRADMAEFEALSQSSQSDEHLDILYRVIQDAAEDSNVQVPDVEIASNEQKVGYLALLLPLGVVQRIELASLEDDAARVGLLHQWVNISEA